jgi:hypothetical protein
MHIATSGPFMIFFFTVVTVILPALVLAGVVAFAARDAIERSALEQPSPSALRSSKFQVPSSKLADHS